MAQYGGGFDGTQYNDGGNMEAAAAKVPPPNYYSGGSQEGAPAILKTIALFIRGAAILLTLTSTAVMGAAKETVTFPYRDPVNDVYLGNVSLEIKSTQSAAFVSVLQDKISFYPSIVLNILLILPLPHWWMIMD